MWLLMVVKACIGKEPFMWLVTLELPNKNHCWDYLNFFCLRLSFTTEIILKSSRYVCFMFAYLDLFKEKVWPWTKSMMNNFNARHCSYVKVGKGGKNMIITLWTCSCMVSIFFPLQNLWAYPPDIGDLWSGML